MQLSGIHHLTAVTANAAGNVDFYTKTLGLRLVKKTVNQDDTSVYHLFYADGRGSPGTDITFFDFHTLPARPGNNSISRTAFRIDAGKSMDWWVKRLESGGVKHGGASEIDGRLTIEFQDAEGQHLALVDEGSSSDKHPWDRSTVPAEHQLHGLGPITMTVPDLRPTDAVLTQVMNMKLVRDYPHPQSNKDRVHVYSMGDSGPAAELHVAVRPDLPRAHPGSGGVHHVAFRTPTFEQYEEWAARLNSLRVPNSGKIDRFYFRSLYFREPNGVLFEIASDQPGFAADEPMEHLGEKLSLPPFLEGRRASIEAGLDPL